MIFVAGGDEEKRREPVEIADDFLISELADRYQVDCPPFGTANDRACHVERGAWKSVAWQHEVRRKFHAGTDFVGYLLEPDDPVRAKVIRIRTDFVSKCQLRQDAIQIVLRLHQPRSQLGAACVRPSVADARSGFIECAEHLDNRIVLAHPIAEEISGALVASSRIEAHRNPPIPRY